MRTIQARFHNYNRILLALILFMFQVTTVHAKDNGCWAEFYEYAQFIGNHFKINGAKRLAKLDNYEGQNWDLRIDSIVVGPKAKVTVFENPNFKLTLTEMAKYPVLMKSLGVTEQDIREDSEIIFPPKEMVHHLGEYNFHKKVRSLTVECVD